MITIWQSHYVQSIQSKDTQWVHYKFHKRKYISESAEHNLLQAKKSDQINLLATIKCFRCHRFTYGEVANLGDRFINEVWPRQQDLPIISTSIIMIRLHQPRHTVTDWLKKKNVCRMACAGEDPNKMKLKTWETDCWHRLSRWCKDTQSEVSAAYHSLGTCGAIFGLAITKWGWTGYHCYPIDYFPCIIMNFGLKRTDILFICEFY